MAGRSFTGSPPTIPAKWGTVSVSGRTRTHNGVAPPSVRALRTIRNDRSRDSRVPRHSRVSRHSRAPPATATSNEYRSAD